MGLMILEMVIIITSSGKGNTFTNRRDKINKGVIKIEKIIVSD